MGPSFVGNSLSRICDARKYNNGRTSPTFLDKRARIVNINFARLLS